MTQGWLALSLAVVACGGSQFASDGGGGGGGRTFVGGGAGVGSSEATAGVAGTDPTPSGGDEGTDSKGGQGGSPDGPPGEGSAGAAGASPMVCDPGTARCSSHAFETCQENGSGWTSKACEFVCDAKTGCVGECSPGFKECDGRDSQTCDATGSWITTTACPFVCAGNGVCGGECVPGTQQCSGKAAQLCDNTGKWATLETCDFNCNFSGGTASCGGACTNGTKQCSGKVPQNCVASEWASSAQCPYVCLSATGTCGGECVPGSAKCGPQGGIQSCSATGQWQSEGTSCPFVCSGGACTGVCVPNGACGDDGNACTDDVCNSTGTACTHPDKTNGAACGSSSSSTCDAPDSCQSGTCQSNPKPASTACTDDANPCTSDVCNGAGGCTHPAAPANTVCRAASCATATSVATQATCGGATTCPASSIKVCEDEPDLNQVGACLAGSCTLECATDFDDCTAALGCESDLRVTADHCGSCERTCIDGPCGDSLCLPNPVVTDRQNNGVFRLAIDSQNLYWTETVGNVVQMGLSSTTPTAIATSQVGARWIALVDGTLYWSVTGNMMTMPASGGTLTPVFATAQAGLGGANAPATSDGSYVYWSNASGKVQRALVSNGSASDVVNPETHGYSFVSALAASSGSIFLGLMDPGNTIMKATSGLATDFATEQPNVADMFIQGNYLYWTTLGASGAPMTGTVIRISLAGASIKTIASSQAAPNQVASDGTYVYWTASSAGDFLVQKAPVAGGPIEVVTNLTSYSPSSRSNLVVSDQHLYWVSGSRVIKVAK